MSIFSVLINYSVVLPVAICILTFGAHLLYGGVVTDLRSNGRGFESRSGRGWAESCLVTKKYNLVAVEEW